MTQPLRIQTKEERRATPLHLRPGRFTKTPGGRAYTEAEYQLLKRQVTASKDRMLSILAEIEPAQPAQSDAQPHDA